MKCPKCGVDLETGARFCGKCGTQMGPKESKSDIQPGSLTNHFIAELIDEIIMVVGAILLVIPGILYFLLQDGLFEGRSIGKKLMGLKVIKQGTGQPCGYMESTIRNLFMLLGPIEYIVVLITKDHKRIGDMVAGTLVINETR